MFRQTANRDLGFRALGFQVCMVSGFEGYGFRLDGFADLRLRALEVRDYGFGVQGLRV